MGDKTALLPRLSDYLELHGDKFTGSRQLEWLL